MVLRKLILVFAIIAGLFAFDGAAGCTRLPQVAQTELVVPGHEQNEVIVVNNIRSTRPSLFVFNEDFSVSFFHHHHHSLLIQSQQQHSSL
jgi:hypothetical protein